MAITENETGQPQLEIMLPNGFRIRTILPSVALQSVPESSIGTTEHERPLPPFDPDIEREAPAALSERIASGEIEVSRESVSIEEVIAKIEALEKEVIEEHGTSG